MQASRRRTIADRRTDARQAPTSADRPRAAAERALSAPDRPTALRRRLDDPELAQPLRPPRAVAPKRSTAATAGARAGWPAPQTRARRKFPKGIADAKSATTIVSFANVSAPRKVFDVAASNSKVSQHPMAPKLIATFTLRLRARRRMAAIDGIAQVNRIHRFRIGNAARQSLCHHPGHDREQKARKCGLTQLGKAPDDPRHHPRRCCGNRAARPGVI